jgi:hypothetical protein
MDNYLFSTLRLAAGILLAITILQPIAYAAEYPWGDGDIPAGVLEDAAKVYFYVDHELGIGTGWDDLDILIIPMYYLDGGVHAYYAIIAVGDYGPVTIEDLLDRSRRFFEVEEEIRELVERDPTGDFTEEERELDRKKFLTVGQDVYGERYTFWFALFYVKKRGVSCYRSGNSLPNSVILLYRTKVNLEEKFGVSDLEFVRFVATGRGYLAEFAGGGKRYFGPTAYHSGVLCDETEITALREGCMALDPDSDPGFTWEFIFEEMENLKRGVRTDRMKPE